MNYRQVFAGATNAKRALHKRGKPLKVFVQSPLSIDFATEVAIGGEKRATGVPIRGF